MGLFGVKNPGSTSNRKWWIWCRRVSWAKIQVYQDASGRRLNLCYPMSNDVSSAWFLPSPCRALAELRHCIGIECSATLLPVIPFATAVAGIIGCRRVTTCSMWRTAASQAGRRRKRLWSWEPLLFEGATRSSGFDILTLTLTQNLKARRRSSELATNGGRSLPMTSKRESIRLVALESRSLRL